MRLLVALGSASALYPFMADIYFGKEFLSSGIHVRAGVVLTGAVLVEKPSELLSVRINASRTLEDRANATSYAVLGVVFHPKFERSKASKYNVALLGLDPPVAPLQPILLDRAGLWKLLPQSGLQLVGWGWEIGEWDDVEMFHALAVRPLRLDECERAHHLPIDASHEFCVDDGQGNERATLMSSGSAVILRDAGQLRLVGFSSWSSYSVFSEYTPPVMLAVSVIADWIDETIE